MIPSYKDTTSYEDYRLRPGDRLYVKVYSTDDRTNMLFNGSQQTSQMALSGGGESSIMDLYTYLVLNDGNIVFPMIGKVKMQDLTLREATLKLEKEIEPYYKFSTVEMKIVARYFSVIGGGKAGYFPIPREKINIFQALAMSGDIDIYGDRSKVRIIRETDTGTQIKVFDIRSVDILHSEFFYIEPNDVIYIQSVDEQFYSVSNLTGLFSTVLTTISFGTIIFNSLFNLK
ncbi:MAG: polysaccharide biosynthesis/export family protein [Paludibacter sp.]|nr:polysaccharide biosynthesis/export family protein [Paludibacter sp.]